MKARARSTESWWGGGGLKVLRSESGSWKATKRRVREVHKTRSRSGETPLSSLGYGTKALRRYALMFKPVCAAARRPRPKR